jgi:hypothetical protein
VTWVNILNILPFDPINIREKKNIVNHIDYLVIHFKRGTRQLIRWDSKQSNIKTKKVISNITNIRWIIVTSKITENSSSENNLFEVKGMYWKSSGKDYH